MPPGQDLTMLELAKLTGFSVNSIRRYAKAGKLEGVYRIGGCYRIPPAAANRLRGLPPDAKGVFSNKR